MSAFEQNLVALDVKLEEAQKLGKAVVAAIGRTRAALKVGRVADISRGLGIISQRIDQANAAVDGVANDWSFDVSGLSGAWAVRCRPQASRRRTRSSAVRE